MTPTDSAKKKAEELAKTLLFSLDMNTCVCDCLGCKTIHCSQCELDKASKGRYERGALCCENDLTQIAKALAQALTSERESSLEAAAKVADRQTGIRCFWCGHELKISYCEQGACVASAIRALK